MMVFGPLLKVILRLISCCNLCLSRRQKYSAVLFCSIFVCLIFSWQLQVPRMEKRVSTLAKLGYKKCIVPESAEKFLSTLDLEGIRILGCRNLKEMINTVFRKGLR